MPTKPLTKPHPRLMALEPRIMFDAALGATIDAVDKGGKGAGKGGTPSTPVDTTPIAPAAPTTPTTPAAGNNDTGNNSTTPTDQAAGAGKSDEEKNDKNVSGTLGDQGNNDAKNDIKGNAGGNNSNDAPLAVDDVYSTDYETEITFDVLENDSDPNGDVLAVTEYTLPEVGTLTYEDGVFKYTPPAGFSGTVTFTYTVDDGSNNPNSSKATATVTITVGEKPNDPPEAQDDDYTTEYDQPVELDLLANDSDPDGERITIVAMTEPSGGTLSIIDGRLVFTPTAGFSGVTTFNYTIRDERGLESTATVTIIVGLAPPEPPPPPPPPPPEPPPQIIVPPVAPPPPVALPVSMFAPPAQAFSPVMPPMMSFPDSFQNVFMSLNTLTISMPESFVMPLPNVDNGLFVLKPPESVTVSTDRSVDYRLPPDTFASTDSSAKIDIVARQTDGSPLPPGITFDPVTGKITGTLPPGVEILDITIEATDSNGKKAQAQFSIRSGEIRGQVMPGKLPLSEQIKLAVLKMKARLV